MNALVPALCAAGVDVEVVSSSAGLDDEGRAAAMRNLAPARATIVPIWGPERIELSPRLVPLLARKIAECDLVHLHTVFTFPLAAAAAIARRAHVPYIVRPAGTLDELCLRNRSYAMKRLALATWVGHMLKGAAAIHATSGLEAHELARWTERIHEVELGAATFEVPPDDGRRGTRLFTIGRLHPIKGLEHLLAAVALSAPDVTLTIAGNGERRYVDSLKARARPLAGRVEFVGEVGDPQKQALFANADLCVFPSLHESFGIGIVEAMAAGRAVIVTDGVGLAPIIAEAGAGLVVAPADAAGLAAAIASMLAAGPDRPRAAEAARALASSRYSWKAAALRTRALYDDVLRRARSIGVTGAASGGS